MPVLFGSFVQYVFMVSMLVVAVFLILLIMVQRGRGGGLAGAFGGLGGQSAFGAKAGDMFTRITMGAAAVWILLCMLAINVLNSQSSSKFDTGTGGSAITGPLEPDADSEADGTTGGDTADGLGGGAEPPASSGSNDENGSP